MQERPARPRFDHKLIMIIEQDEGIGTRFVQLIRQETPFQAILATSLSQVRNILCHLICHLLLLTDPTFPAEHLERLYMLPEDLEPETLPPLFWTYKDQDKADIRSVINAVKLLLSIPDVSPGMLSLSGLNSDHARWVTHVLTHLPVKARDPARGSSVEAFVDM